MAFGQERSVMPGAVDSAKHILAVDEKVQYGIFGLIGGSGYFPPKEFLNEFLMVGCDPCDQDGRMSSWEPFALSHEEYDEVKAWWASAHPGTVASNLGVGCWQDWACVIISPEDWGFPDGLPRPAEPNAAPARGE